MKRFAAGVWARTASHSAYAKTLTAMSGPGTLALAQQEEAR